MVPDMITEQFVINKIKEIVHSIFDIDIENVPNDTLISNAGLDSMAMLDVIMGLEDATGVKFKDVTLPKDPTLADVARMVVRNVG